MTALKKKHSWILAKKEYCAELLLHIKESQFNVWGHCLDGHTKLITQDERLSGCVRLSSAVDSYRLIKLTHHWLALQWLIKAGCHRVGRKQDTILSFLQEENIVGSVSYTNLRGICDGLLCIVNRGASKKANWEVDVSLKFLIPHTVISLSFIVHEDTFS